jgi:hypothetical protein
MSWKRPIVSVALAVSLVGGSSFSSADAAWAVPASLVPQLQASIAMGIIRAASPYAMATGYWARNWRTLQRQGYTFNDVLEASRCFFGPCRLILK